MAETGTLHEAFVDELRDVYDAEKQLIKALPKMAKAATSAGLRSAFESHLDETRGHVARLEQVFAALDERVRGKHCDGIAGIIEEGNAVMSEDFADATMDACLLRAASVRSTTRWPPTAPLSPGRRAMGHTDAAELLQATLDEEKAADEKLSALAEGGINQDAAAGAHLEEQGDDEEEVAVVASPARGKSARTAAADRRSSRRT